MVTFLAYLEFPNSILIKNPKIGRITFILPDSPDIPPLAKCAAPATTLYENSLVNGAERDYKLADVPSFMLGGQYIGSACWPGEGDANWDLTINYVGGPCIKGMQG